MHYLRTLTYLWSLLTLLLMVAKEMYSSLQSIISTDLSCSTVLLSIEQDCMKINIKNRIVSFISLIKNSVVAKIKEKQE